MEKAVRDFLAAAGLDPDKDPDLEQTPALVARAWTEELLDGYRVQPNDVLADRIPAPRSKARELVIVTGMPYESVCPHHLLPYRGLAHVAYSPGGCIVGFGQIGRLLDCLSHRLVLQEELARQIARALTDELDAHGAGVILEAEQSCLTLRGGRRAGAKTIAEAYTGVMAEDAELRGRLLAAVQGR